MSFLNRALRVAKTIARSPQTRRLIRSVTSDAGKKTGQRSAPRPSAATTSGLPGPNDHAVVYSVAKNGMPNFVYDPAQDGDADPGEVVWTWVPYEDDPTQGKDRPVLVLARLGDAVVFAQMTSQDHVEQGAGVGREDHLGRQWIEMGSGDWDRQGRPSEARIDRLLVAHKNSIRREGGKLDKTRFTQITRAISSIHSR